MWIPYQVLLAHDDFDFRCRIQKGMLQKNDSKAANEQVQPIALYFQRMKVMVCINKVVKDSGRYS